PDSALTTVPAGPDSMQPHAMPEPLADTRYAFGLAGLFLVLAAVATSQHEMFRDELQAWLLGRDSVSLAALLRNLKYEGHPGLWHLCLMLVSRVFPSPVAMQVFH